MALQIPCGWPRAPKSHCHESCPGWRHPCCSACTQSLLGSAPGSARICLTLGLLHGKESPLAGQAAILPLGAGTTIYSAKQAVCSEECDEKPGRAGHGGKRDNFKNEGKSTQLHSLFSGDAFLRLHSMSQVLLC